MQPWLTYESLHLLGRGTLSSRSIMYFVTFIWRTDFIRNIGENLFHTESLVTQCYDWLLSAVEGKRIWRSRKLSLTWQILLCWKGVHSPVSLGRVFIILAFNTSPKTSQEVSVYDKLSVLIHMPSKKNWIVKIRHKMYTQKEPCSVMVCQPLWCCSNTVLKFYFLKDSCLHFS